MPARAPSNPSTAYSLSMMRPICDLVAPSTLSSTPSRSRSRRVAATALTSTGTPMISANTAMKRIAVLTLSRMLAMVRVISEMSSELTLGYLRTTSRWSLATAASPATFAITANCFGAS